MTLEERQAAAQFIYNEAEQRLKDECGYFIYPTLIPELPSDQYLVVKPQIQLREIAGWVAEEHRIVKTANGPTLQTVKKPVEKEK